MARFYASIQGNRGRATRVGTEQSGITGHIRGWDSGVRVEGHYNKETNSDVFQVHITSGSGGRDAELLIATVAITEGHRVEVVLTGFRLKLARPACATDVQNEENTPCAGSSRPPKKNSPTGP